MRLNRDFEAQSPPPPNLDRLIEDLNRTLPLLSDRESQGRPLHPPIALLEELGARLLGNDPSDERAAHRRSERWHLQSIVTSPCLPILAGAVRLSYFLASVVYAQRARRSEFCRAGEWDWEASLQWLVLYGVDAHALWTYVPSWFILDLKRRSLRRNGFSLTPLQLCVLRECPTLAHDLPRPDHPEFGASFEAWLAAEGTGRYNLFWLRSSAKLRARLTRAPDQNDAHSSPTPDLPSGVIWPSPEANRPATATATRHGLVYRSFGADFPAVRLTGEHTDGLSEGAWHGFVRRGEGGSVELCSSRLRLPLPSISLPAGVLLLGLQIPDVLANLLWLQVALNGQVVDFSGGHAYTKRRPVKLPLPAGVRGAAPVLEFQFVGLPEAFAAIAGNGTFARLQGLEYWRLAD